ncbi:hypothetical protein IWW36_001798 [Coemansia brasiliensis]|uniref:Uncharacterized protein n=1 Tax=Coemansia brasiliensis TaxID=2650707 RepID=A0A9W8IAY3_9FUNG|nr:hypothetical protein IWW36_001798 [Coemansia brasiliensis]
MPKPMATFEHLLPENSLTFLETTWNDHNHQKVAQAIHTNAKSLAKLHLRFNSAAGSKYFLTKDGKECLVFPNLTVISLSRVCHEEIKMISPVSKLIPFPHLQVAEIGFKYPFADDILFRGNNKVLDTVNLVLDCKVINILLFDRWVNGRKPNLRSMVLFEAVSQINQYCSKSMYQQFFDKIFSSVRYFYSHSQHITDSLVQSLIPHRHYDNLQILSLINCTITLTQFLKLLDAFPGLFKIICSAPGYDGVFADKNIKEIFSKVKGILGEFRPCIGYWMISDPTVLPVDQIVELIILVTGLCPNLREINFGLRVEERVLCIYTKLCHSFQLIRYSDIVPAIESFTLSYEKSKPSIIVTKKSIELKE